jgi:hypothetical protein
MENIPSNEGHVGKFKVYRDVGNYNTHLRMNLQKLLQFLHASYRFMIFPIDPHGKHCILFLMLG